MKRLLPLILIVLLMGCAAQYEYIVEEEEEAGPQWTEVQIDSIIKFNRMYFFDYYNQMSRKSDFDDERCRKALSYFWEYIPLDNAGKYNDFPQAARCYIELAMNNPELTDSVCIVYEMGLERFPESDYLHNALGIIYKNKGDLSTAESHFITASEIDSTKPEYLIPLTEIYQLNAEWDKAKDVCEKVLALDPSASVIRDRLETILRDHFSLEEYIASLKKKLELEPENIAIWLKLSQQYLNQGKNQEAESAVNGALKLDENNVEALALLGAIKENLADHGSAIEAYKKILQSKTNDLRIMLDIASCYKNLKNYSTARTYVMKALTVEPGNGAAYLKLGEVYEACADANSRGKQATYSDKLVFTIAHGLFKKAANSNDYNARENASRKINYLENNQIIPQKSDWFMRQKQLTPNGSGYEWINNNWNEVKYISTFLKRYQ